MIVLCDAVLHSSVPPPPPPLCEKAPLYLFFFRAHFEPSLFPIFTLNTAVKIYDRHDTFVMKFK